MEQDEDDGIGDGALHAAFNPPFPPESGGPVPSDESDPREIDGGRYRLVHQIGRGGQGTVFLAEDTTLRRRVAIKFLTGLGPGMSTMLRRFRREAEVTSRLDHPGICPIYDTGVDRGVPFITMRYVDGETLARRIAGSRASADETLVEITGQDLAEATKCDPSEMTPVPATQHEIGPVLALIEKASRAVHAAHEAGVIHRDIKPGNIMVTPSGDPVILDFGLARDMESDETALTLTGELFGSPAYMSPEQISSHRMIIDRRTDVYSLGVTLYECLTLRRPFDASTREGLFRAIQSEAAPDPRIFNPAISADAAVILETAMAKERDRRYQTAEAFAEDLRRTRVREPILAKPVGRWTKFVRWTQRNRGLATAIAASATLLLTGSIVSVIFALRAEALAAEARANLVAYNRLADAGVLDDLLREDEEELWPAVPARIKAMEEWLAKADELAKNLPAHEADLSTLRSMADPYTDKARSDDRASHREEVEWLEFLEAERNDLAAALKTLPAGAGDDSRRELRREAVELSLASAEAKLSAERERLEPIVSERLTWEFTDQTQEFRQNKLADLVKRLRAFVGNDAMLPGIRSVKKRLAFAGTLAERTIGAHRGAWRDCLARMAANPEYAGLDLPEQVGLVPLGPDPSSVLEEFAETATGEPPSRDPGSGAIVVTEGMSLVFVLLPGGAFVMGAQKRDLTGLRYDSAARSDEGPPHEVRLSAYFLSKYEMTQGQWLQATGTNPSYHAAGRKVGGDTYDRRCPVEQVNWEESTRILRRLGLSLPTEARWEHACRAGTTTPWSTGADAASLAGAANVADAFFRTHGGPGEWPYETWNDGFTGTSPVGSFRPNGFGFHDLHGNVWEACLDGHGPYSRRARERDGLRTVLRPPGRIARGGSCTGVALIARSSQRASMNPADRDYFHGLRPCREIAR